MRRHELKTLPEYFWASWIRVKGFEIRFNDRDFKVGDQVILQEWSQQRGYSGREIFLEIRYLTSFGLQKGYVAMDVDETGRTGS